MNPSATYVVWLKYTSGQSVLIRNGTVKLLEFVCAIRLINTLVVFEPHTMPFTGNVGSEESDPNDFEIKLIFSSEQLERFLWIATQY